MQVATWRWLSPLNRGTLQVPSNAGEDTELRAVDVRVWLSWLESRRVMLKIGYRPMANPPDESHSTPAQIPECCGSLHTGA